MISCNQTSCTSASSSYSLSLALPCRAKPSWSSCCTSQRPGSRPPAPVRIVLTPRRASEDDDAERTDRLDSSDRRPLAAINSHQQTAPCLQMLVATFGVWMVPQPAIPTTLCHWMLVLCSVPSCPFLSHLFPPWLDSNTLQYTPTRHFQPQNRNIDSLWSHSQRGQTEKTKRIAPLVLVAGRTTEYRDRSFRRSMTLLRGLPTWT